MDMQTKEHVPGITRERMEVLKERMLESYPSIAEGWSRIVDNNRSRGQDKENDYETRD